MTDPNPKPTEMDNGVYFAYTTDTDPVEAAENYERRFGKEPEKQFTEANLLLCGPVSEE